MPTLDERARMRLARVGVFLAASGLAVACVLPIHSAGATTPPTTPSQTTPPTGTPTSTPTATGPTSTPTQTSTETPTDPPTSTPTTPPPTTTPPTTPSGTPTLPPPGVPVAPIIDQEAAAAFALATTHLRAATDALDAANAKLANPGVVALAMGHALRADSDVATAGQRVGSILAALQHQRLQVTAANYAVGGSARIAYVDGPSAGLSTILASEGLADLANRMGTLDAVGRSSDRAVDDLASAEEQVDALQSDLTAAQNARAAAVAERDGLVAQAEQMRKAAVAARAALPTLQTAVDEAVAEAKAAIPADQALAAQRGAESDRLASEILAASDKLEDEGGVVNGTGSMVVPGTGPITSPYGWRFHPILHYYKLHTGVDFAGDDGVVYAADDGVVILTVWSSAYGNVTVIDHGRAGGQHLATFYAHQAGFFVEPGDVVHKGEPIGAVGATGLATGPHVHFEVRVGGLPVDPMPFLPD